MKKPVFKNTITSGQKDIGKALKAKQRQDSVKKSTKVDGDESNVEHKTTENSQPIQMVKPDDQLTLTEEELKEEFTRVLTANNPHAPDNIVRFSYKENCYKPIPSVNQLAVHFKLEGVLLHKESDEAERQTAQMKDFEIVDENYADNNDGDNAARETLDRDQGFNSTLISGQRDAKLTNQFVSCDRASQSYTTPCRNSGTITEPPARADFSETATQWNIHDAYVEDLIQKREKEKDGRKKTEKENDKKKKGGTNETLRTGDISRLVFSSKIMERMVSQNNFDSITRDLRYFEDASDEYRNGKGTCLPLWKFSYEHSKRMTVTAISWCPQYHDLFVVGYGSYDFLKQPSGMVCLYSFKNPSHPEHVYSNEHGIMCIDIHPVHSHLIVIGFYDGTVAVFNLKEKIRKPVYKSDALNGKHTDPVWEVRWQKYDGDGNLNFSSVSSDGRVVLWTIVKDQLRHSDILKLPINNPNQDNTTTQDLTPNNLSCGTCMDFHKSTDHLFLVGTEEGRIHKCSKAYSNKSLRTYNAHHLMVYAVKWNYFHSKIFISCSADWTIKIWDHTHPDPFFTFDSGSAVNDVAWAPYSSTVFAAVTADGEIIVYDLSVDRFAPICRQSVYARGKGKLSHISFNPVYPVALVGDDKGTVTSVKLSPNLRKAMLHPKGTDHEIEKMDKLLASVRKKV